MIVLTVDGAQLDAYLIILFGNVAIPWVFDNIRIVQKMFRDVFSENVTWNYNNL